MTQTETFQYEMLDRTGDFGVAQAAIFADSTLAVQMFAQVNASVLQLDQHAATKVTGRAIRREGASTKALERTGLRKQMEAINHTSRALAIDTPHVDDKFQLPPSRSDQALLSTARSFAENAAPLAGEFIAHAMPEAFLDELNAGIARFEQAMHDHGTGRATQTAARARIRASLNAGLTAVRRLDAIVANQLRDDPVTMALWDQARHLELAPKRKKGASTAAAAAPAPTAAATTSTI